MQVEKEEQRLRESRIKALITRYKKLQSESIHLSTWIIMACMPFFMVLQTALQQEFAYKLPGANWDRVIWSVSFFAGSVFMAILATAGAYSVKMHWGLP